MSGGVLRQRDGDWRLPGQLQHMETVMSESYTQGKCGSPAFRWMYIVAAGHGYFMDVG